MAKKTVANLNIRIGASSATLTRDFQRNQAAVRGFASSAVSRLGSVVASIGGLLAASAAATLSIRGMVDAFGDIDKVAKLADRIGATTEGIVGLRQAAELSGASTETLDKSLEQMVRRLGEAVGGTGEAKDTLDELGLSAINLANMTPEAAFRQIADAINTLPTAAQKAQAAYDLFGRAGQQLLNTLALGSDGLDKIQQDVDELGISFSRVDAAKVEEANDAITRMKDSFAGLTRELAIAFAPAVQATAEAISGIVKWMRSLNVDTVKTTAKVIAFVGGFTLALSIVPKVISAIKAIIATVRALAVANTIANATSLAGLATLAVGLGVGTAAAVGINNAFDSLESKVSNVTGASDKLGDSISGLKGSAEGLSPSFDKVADSLASMPDAIDTGLVDRLEDRLGDLREQLRDVENSKFESSFQDLRVGAAVRGTTAGFAAVSDGQNQLRKIADDTKKGLEFAKRRTEDIRDIKDAIESVEKKISDAKTTTHKII